MRIRAVLLGLLVALLMVVLGSSGRVFAEDNDPNAAPQSERIKELEEKLRMAVDRFEIGQYERCKAVLENLMGDNISPSEAFHLRQVFGAEILHKMSAWMFQGRTLGDCPLYLLSRANLHEMAMLRDPKYIKNLVEMMVTKEELANDKRFSRENVKRMYDLIRIGSFTSGPLFDIIKNNKSNSQRSVAAALAIQLGPQMVPPAVEALRSNDDNMSQYLCSIIGKIKPGDPRALPRLKIIYDNSERLESVRKWAGYAIREITGMEPEKLPPAEELVYQEAARLLRGGYLVNEQMVDLRKALWVWDPKNGYLKHVETPTFELDDILAQDLIYEGLKLTKDPRKFHILLVYSLLQQSREIREMSKILDLKFETVPLLKDEQAEIGKWKFHVQNGERIAWSSGLDTLMDVLDKAVLDGNAEVVKATTAALENVAGPHGWEKVIAWKPYLPKSAKTAPAGDGTKEPDENKESDSEEAKEVAEGNEAAQEIKAVESPVAEKAAEVTEIEAAEIVEKAETDAADYSLADQDNPLIVLLDHPSEVMKIAAANAVQRIGLPHTHPRYKQVVDILVDGARAKSQTIALIVSNNALVRTTMVNKLKKKGIVGIAASTGREAFSLAVQNPPKDVILIDAEIEEFAYLKQRLAMQQMAPGSPLPLTVITTRARVEKLSQQFPKELWDIQVMKNVSSDSAGLYDAVRRNLSSNEEGKLKVVILTNEERAERSRIREKLITEAERRGRPVRQSELLRLLNKKEWGDDYYAVRNGFVNIFLDDDLAGFNAMHTVQRLRSDIRTTKTPIMLMGEKTRLKMIETEFERFLKENAKKPFTVEDIDKLDELALSDKVIELGNRNPLHGKNYVRSTYDRIALRSAIALRNMNVRDTGIVLTVDQAEWLKLALIDKDRPVKNRIEIAKVLGHFKVDKAGVTNSLRTTYADETQKASLRAACMEALGMIDLENKYFDAKITAMTDSSELVRAAAARALSWAGDKKITDTQRKLRFCDPLELLKNPVKAATTKADGAAEGEGDANGGEGAAPEDNKEGEKENDEGGDELNMDDLLG